jgi:hypothetical protein
MFGPSFFLPKVESDEQKFTKQVGKTPEEILRSAQDDEKVIQDVTKKGHFWDF